MRRAGDNKFVDNIFPPDISSLCFDPYSNKMDPDIKEAVSQVASWRRPNEWCKNPQLMKDDASPGDIEQGQLGDCWLLSALGVVAVRPQLLKHIFVKIDAVRGEYTLRFYREGRWEEVTIDDRIPCGKDGLPVFAHCVDPEEIWVPIIEKAMAKMLGTYEAIDGGYLEEGVVMLTGGRPEKVTINNWKGKAAFEETSADLWHKLLTYFSEGHMMGSAICSGKEMPDKTTGLVAGHAYGVLDVRETYDKKFKMIKLRNPWGSFEWKGRWSDGAREWNKAYIDDLQQTNKDDGTFWMELTDFRKYFDKITVCRVFNLRLLTLSSPIATAEDKQLFGNVDWHRAKFECEWNDSNAGGILNDATYGQNPHLRLNITERGRMFFLIAQPALTTQAESRYYRTGIGFAIQKGTVDRKGMVRLPAPNQQDESIFVQNPVRNRYNSAHLLVNPGPYVIVPFTDFPNRKTKFVFEIYAEKPFISSVLLPEDKDACRDALPSARANGASVAAVGARVSNMAISAPPAVASPVTIRVPEARPAAPTQPGRRVDAPVEVQARQRKMVPEGRQPVAGRDGFDRAAKPQAKSAASPSKPRPVGGVGASPSRTSGVPVAQRAGAPQRASPSKAKVSVPTPQPKDDRFMTTSQMFYRK